jgi:AraC family transcriptional regulator
MHESTKYETISSSVISPHVLFCSFFSNGMELPVGQKFKSRYVFDYELEYIIDSKGFMTIEDSNYSIQKGDVIFRLPGQYAQGISPYSCYLICFDMLSDPDKASGIYDLHGTREFQINYKNPILEDIHSINKFTTSKIMHDHFKEAFNLFVKNPEGNELILKSIVLKIIYELYNNSISSLNSLPIASAHYITFKKTLDYIENNYTSKIVLNDLASIALLSPAHFHKLFHKLTKETPNEYITRLRLNKAKGLLVNTTNPISDIAFECGYDNLPYFSFLFKKATGMNPSTFRQKYTYIYS